MVCLNNNSRLYMINIFNNNLKKNPIPRLSSEASFCSTFLKSCFGASIYFWCAFVKSTQKHCTNIYFYLD